MRSRESRRLGAIASELFPICLEVEKRIAGKDGDYARRWARADSVRHAHTVRAIVRFAETSGASPLRILNASGLYHGHQDFSIATYLRAHRVPFEWEAYESAESEYLAHPQLQALAVDLNVRIEMIDYRRLYDEPIRAPSSKDIVLFTEIAEHLDHSALLRALGYIHSQLAAGGLLILTTPNLVSVPNRLRFLVGNADAPYFGDGTANLERGLYGHVTNFDRVRLKRILADIGFAAHEAYTFDWGRAWREDNRLRRLALTTLNGMSAAVPNAKQTIFIAARRSSSKHRIPFAT